MLIREASDLHVEFWNFAKLKRTLEKALPSLATDRETVLLVCGDLGTFRHYRSTLKPILPMLAERFREVLYVYGNHEWYRSNVWGKEDQFWQENPLPENVTILDDGYRIIDDVVFIGSTLWTDFNGCSKPAMDAAAAGMNDFHVIYTGTRSEPVAPKPSEILTPQETVERHLKSRAFIFDTCHQFCDSKRVVLTHHSPGQRSIHPRYHGQLLNYAFFSDLENEINSCGPDLWFHGHTHHSFDHTVGRTRIICNPFGYLNTMDQNKEYDPALLLEI